MIQRIQTLLLLAAATSSLLLFLIPSFYLLPASELQGEIYRTTLLKTTIILGNAEKELLKNWPLLITNSLLIILYLITIFSYRKRLSQVKFCNISLLLQTGLAVLLIYGWKQLKTVAGEAYLFSPGWGLILFILSFILVLLARHYILKDEALVRSADRLR